MWMGMGFFFEKRDLENFFVFLGGGGLYVCISSHNFHC